jgi:hypothetical protein
MGGNAQAIANQVFAYGGRGVLLKIADANHAFYQGPLPPAQIVTELQQTGLIVSTWSYHYGEPYGEADAVLSVLRDCRPTCHVLDVEAEVEASAPVSWARTIIPRLQAGTDVPLAYSPLPIISYHPSLPYYQLSVEYGLTVLPQTYWTGLQWAEQRTVNTFYQQLSDYGLWGQYVYPAYQDTPGCWCTTSDVVQFVADIVAQDATGFSVWSFEHMDTAAWQRFGDACSHLPQQQAEPVIPEKTDGLWGWLGQVSAWALGAPEDARAAQASVVAEQLRAYYPHLQ